MLQYQKYALAAAHLLLSGAVGFVASSAMLLICALMTALTLYGREERLATPSVAAAAAAAAAATAIAVARSDTAAAAVPAASGGPGLGRKVHTAASRAAQLLGYGPAAGGGPGSGASSAQPLPNGGSGGGGGGGGEDDSGGLHPRGGKGAGKGHKRELSLNSSGGRLPLPSFARSATAAMPPIHSPPAASASHLSPPPRPAPAPAPAPLSPIAGSFTGGPASAAAVAASHSGTLPPLGHGVVTPPSRRPTSIPGALTALFGAGRSPSVSSASPTGATPFNLFTMQGVLWVKHERRPDGSQPFFRAWKHAFAVVRGNVLSLYQKTSDIQQESTDGAYLVAAISHCEVPDDYQKRPFTLRLYGERLSRHLIQLETAEDVAVWLEKFGNPLARLAASQ